MNTLEEEFERFYKAAVPFPECNMPLIRDFAWQAFVAGAAHVFEVTGETVENDDPKTYFQMRLEIEGYLLRLSNGIHGAPSQSHSE